MGYNVLTVRLDTYQRLLDLKLKKGQSFNEVIKELLDYAEKAITPPADSLSREINREIDHEREREAAAEEKKSIGE